MELYPVRPSVLVSFTLAFSLGLGTLGLVLVGAFLGPGTPNPPDAWSWSHVWTFPLLAFGSSVLLSARGYWVREEKPRSAAGYALAALPFIFIALFSTLVLFLS